MRRALTIIGIVFMVAGCLTVPPIGSQDSAVEPGHDLTPGESKRPHDTTAPDSEQTEQVAADPPETTKDPSPEPPVETKDPEPEELPAQPGVLSAEQIMLVDAAREILQTQSTIVGATTYSYDCSGTILTVYAHAGIYLVDLFPRYTGNGVARLYGIAADYELLHTRDLPEPGDLIFWDNTYDRNGDGNWNDPLTHAGLVISVSENGTVEYLHHNYRRGIVTATMNLLEPEVYQDDNGEMLNAPMRMASQRASNPDLWLSSHLFREFGSLHRVRIEAASNDGAEAVASLP